MNAASPAYFEMVEFIAGGPSTEEVARYRPSANAQVRLSELLEKASEGELSTSERSEVEDFMHLEHILRMAKAKARQMLDRGQ